jgi:DNA uptake protein ComE-like DNA-binding protein
MISIFRRFDYKIAMIGFVLYLMVVPLSARQVDINNASLDEIMTLPLTVEQAEALHHRIYYQGPLETVYDIVDLEEIDSETFLKIKSLIFVGPEKAEEGSVHLQDSYRNVERWTAIEGANEGLIEVWLDRISEPSNINNATYDDLVSLQNVSPVDAVAVIKKRNIYTIGYAKDLRGTPGLSYWGYRNMVDFVTFDDADKSPGDHFWYNMLFKTIPSTVSFDEESEAPESFRSFPPALHHKFTFSRGSHFKLSMAYHRQLGEDVSPVNQGGIPFPGGKAAVTLRDIKLGPLKLERLILGNFSVTIGQGVVMESTDFWSPRRTGYGWSKRVHGVFSDISQTVEYSLRGAAIQVRINKLLFLGFLSKNHRDAVLNSDGESFTSLITMYPRRDSISAEGLMIPIANTVEEMTLGGQLKYTFSPGTFIGLTSYESLYNKELRPDIPGVVIAAGNKDKYLTQIGNSADTEIEAMYASAGSSPLWSDAKAVRRVHGVEFSTVLNNLAIQGEYGILDKDGEIFNFRNDPSAFVINAYLQFNSLNFLVVYRDYDLEFDNPYQRSISNYQRYKSTILEDSYYLKDPSLSYLYTGTAQPQAERGWYLSSRYQFHRQWVTTNQFDTWTRVSDNARYYRIVSNMEYRPVFNYRFRIRQKWQARATFNSWSPTGYTVQETRLTANFRLSRYDNIRLLYAVSAVEFNPRRRLTLDLLSGGEDPSMVGSASLSSEALSFTATHNFSDRLKVIGSVIMYDGFFWNFEDTDFRIYDSPTDALRWWVTIFSRISERWAFRFKVSSEGGGAVTNYAFEPQDASSNGRLLWETLQNMNETMDFRFQMDYAF